MTHEFTGLRSYLWPIRRHELSKLLPMFAMLFLICFNYSILRNMKDALVVTAKNSGAEVIPFIKVWAMLPMAIVLTWVFAKLSSYFSQEKIVYMMISGFLLFFIGFVFVIYPNQDLFHPHHFADFLQETLPRGCYGLVAMIRNWTFTGFYVMSELWGAIVLTVLFWGFANQVTTLSEAKRFYSVFTIGGNLAAVVAGQTANFFTRHTFSPVLGLGGTAWEQTLISLVSIIVLSGIAMMLLFRWFNKYVLERSWVHKTPDAPKKGTKRKRLSLRESFRYLAKSRYLLHIAVLVVSYNLVINLVEVVWKDQLRQLHPDPTSYNIYMNNVTSAMGVISTLMAIAIVWLIHRWGWTFTSLLTPLILLSTSLLFFGLLLFQQYFHGVAAALLGLTPLSIAVFVGAAQNSMSKGAKYSLFDTTKEIAFIPLDHTVKLKGKAAIDGVGSRMGKSGGSLIHQGLLMIFGTIAFSTPYVAVIVLIVIALWMFSTRSLGRQFHELTGKDSEDIRLPVEETLEEESAEVAEPQRV